MTAILCNANRCSSSRRSLYFKGLLLLFSWLRYINLLSVPLLPPIASRNLLLLPSLPNSIPYRQANVRRRKDEPCVGTAARGSLARLSRLPRRLPSDGGASGRVRRTLSTHA